MCICKICKSPGKQGKLFVIKEYDNLDDAICGKCFEKEKEVMLHLTCPECNHIDIVSYENARNWECPFCPTLKTKYMVDNLERWFYDNLNCECISEMAEVKKTACITYKIYSDADILFMLDYMLNRRDVMQ